VPHPCSRCGAAVDDSSPFCPACEAPQVRFVPSESVRDTVQLHPETAPPPAAPIPQVEPRNLPYPPARPPDQTRLLRAVVYAGAIGSLLSLLPLAFLIGLPLAGVLAVRFYRGRFLGLPVPPRLGFRLGALSGLFAFLMLVLVRTISISVSGGGGEFREGLVQTIHRAQAMNPDPQAQRVFNFFLTQQGMALMIIIGLLFTLAVFVLLAGVGGLISASMANRRPR
jgi:hypothetical protein